ncbi:hypothetical protein HMPREF3227_02097 [Corynebacterium sp. CMW7794]|nr:hypothetical protein HMPREF0307_02246 [Corynebacterium sp. DNF00584]KXI16149.1 hypothetical protein HMPREF3227_02097 [Corynebacterium sp. CMW7794]
MGIMNTYAASVPGGTITAAGEAPFRMEPMVALGVILLILAVALVVIGGLAAARKLPGNNVIGLRVEEARKSREAWEFAHSVAGPVWILGGVALLFGGLVALIAHGWMWIIPALGFIVAVLAVSVGANMGARAAFLFDQNEKAKEAAGPAVDLTALRRAARKADNK